MTNISFEKFKKNFSSVNDESTLLEKRKSLFNIIVNEANTYEDVDRLAEKGIITLEGIIELLENFDEVCGISTKELQVFEKILEGFLFAPRIQRTKKALL